MSKHPNSEMKESVDGLQWKNCRFVINEFNSQKKNRIREVQDEKVLVAGNDVCYI